MAKKTRDGATAPESPYLAARREWNERYGDHVRAAHHWRLAALASLLVAGGAVAGLVVIAGESRVVPYAVELNGHSEVVQVRRADVLRKPNSNEVRAAIRQWIIGARTVYSDPVALRAVVDQTYALTAANGAAYKALAAYDTANNPFAEAATKTVTVQVNVIVPVSETSWHVEWTETTRLASGDTTTAEWQGTVTAQITPPTTESALMVNPIGVYVTNYAWTQRIEG
ncbi:MAG: conjugal transfer protein [Paracoccaceae bacterium]|nr:conjugal transfer protein [Paracoccaceae bacterium]